MFLRVKKFGGDKKRRYYYIVKAIKVRDIENPADCVTFCAGFSNRYSRKQRSLINGNIYKPKQKVIKYLGTIQDILDMAERYDKGKK